MQIELQKLVAGVDWDWEESVNDYPASTHQLKYLLKRANENTITLTASASGNSHVFEIDRAVTAAYPKGWYTYQAIIVSRTDATDIHEVGAPGLVQVYPDLTTEPDPRSFELQMVDKIKTALLALAEKTMSSVSIEGHTYTYKDEDKLISMLNYWERKSGSKKRQRVLYQFDNN